MRFHIKLLRDHPTQKWKGPGLGLGTVQCHFWHCIPLVKTSHELSVGRYHTVMKAGRCALRGPPWRLATPKRKINVFCLFFNVA